MAVVQAVVADPQRKTFGSNRHTVSLYTAYAIITLGNPTQVHAITESLYALFVSRPPFKLAGATAMRHPEVEIESSSNQNRTVELVTDYIIDRIEHDKGFSSQKFEGFITRAIAKAPNKGRAQICASVA